jgi:hypothetical protein
MIPDELVQATWKEVARFQAARAHKEMARLGKRQADLLAFVVHGTEDLSAEAHELAIYLFFVVTRVFEKSGKVARIHHTAILEQFQNNTDELERLSGAHEQFIESAAIDQISRQPYVMGYIVEALMERGDEPGSVALTEDESGTLFIVLKTAVDVLDAALKSS